LLSATRSVAKRPGVAALVDGAGWSERLIVDSPPRRGGAGPGQVRLGLRCPRLGLRRVRRLVLDDLVGHAAALSSSVTTSIPCGPVVASVLTSHLNLLTGPARILRPSSDRPSPDRQRRAYGHQLRQRQDLLVAHADAAMGDAAGDQLRLVGAVDADEPAAGPIALVLGARTGPEGQRPVRRPGETRESVAHVEAPARRRPPRLPDADARAEDDAASLRQGGDEVLEVDDQVRVDGAVSAERRAWEPAGAPRWARRQGRP
jgi:hypothetical protein